ncbi:Ribosomal RNA small subunit methyltransferase E [Rhodobacteraceae bacterium THAF1]|nr:Ribosomal RNA small subunit methyltransferase E [Palleronia sp. THAF1]VDC16694.1 Ribosomal RNA small subunit methyltransferase E [Rhodobacteraceae bacterium THAF1]
MPLDAGQAHYLFGVMRKGVGEIVEVFDGVSGTWLAEVVEARKKVGVLACREQIAPQRDPPDLWLLFAPIKKVRTDFIVEKAAELGAKRIVPVLTDFTNSERVRADRLQAHAVEAAEQCGGNYVPEVTEAAKLDRVLADWDPARRILFCDESAVGEASDFRRLSPGSEAGPWAILIGPEGGFSEAERARLLGLDHAHPVSLGPRILRADTAAVAALTLWQAALGDWV